MRPPEDDVRNELVQLAGDLATRAARVHRDGRKAILDVAEKTSPFDLVTQIDREAERVIVEGIEGSRPDDAILGEEGSARAGSSGVRWVVDPLDGTVNYVYGYPAFTVSIGVEIEGRPTVGVVYDTSRDLLYAGIAGREATRDGGRISVSDKADPATALLATGFSFDPARRARQADVLVRLLPHVRDIRRSGAASVDLCAVASGEVDAYYEVALAPWDVAAGSVIAQAAGAQVLVEALEGEPGVSVLAANPTLTRELLPLLRRVGVHFRTAR